MPTITRVPLPSTTPGTERQLTFIGFGEAGARPKAYLQAAVHANEMPGAMALHHLMPMLAAAERDGRLTGEVIVAPLVNPIGLAQIVGANHLGRYELNGRENFNRNWIDLAEAVSKRAGARLAGDATANVASIRSAALAALDALTPANELQAMRREVMRRSVDADLVLDLHCDQQASVHLFASAADWPGPAQTLAAQIGAEAVLCNAPFPAALTFSGVHSALWPRLAARFPDASIPQACFAGTIEYRGQHETNHRLGRADATNLYRFLQRGGFVAGRAPRLPALRADRSPMEAMDVGYAPRAGVLAYLADRGARVRKGQVICEVIDMLDPRGKAARVPVRAATSGVLFSRKLDGRLVWPGAVLFRIAGTKPLAHREGLTGLDD